MTQFYAKLPKKVTEQATRLRKVMETGEVDLHLVMQTFFNGYWNEFRAWWLKTMHEQLDYTTFALAPHNAEFFTEWVFFRYPQVMDAVVVAMDEAGCWDDNPTN